MNERTQTSESDAARQRLIDGYEKLTRDYEAQNKSLRFHLRLPMILIMFPVAALFRDFIRHNEEMMDYNRERVAYHKKNLGSAC